MAFWDASSDLGKEGGGKKRKKREGERLEGIVIIIYLETNE